MTEPAKKPAARTEPPLEDPLPAREPIAVKPERNPGDLRITIVLVLSGIVAVLIGIGTPAIIRTSNMTTEVRAGNELASCRSEASALVSEARSRLDLADSNLALLTNRGLIAAVGDDDATVLDVAGQLPSVQAEVVAAQGNVQTATATYLAALDEAKSDPESFLAECRGS